MIDFARITVRAGDGGNGSGSFFRIKGKRYGKADGGDGGAGGNVYCQATGDLNTLEKYRYARDYKAANGGNGASNRRRGVQGEDLTLLVPVGTTVKVSDNEVDPRQSSMRGSTSTFDSTFDLVEDGQKALVARSGQGGRGNAHLKDEFGRRPRVGEKGEEGEAVSITLELKLIADVGLIGLPNAGKSTLLSKLTRAEPKIAPYPFTTLEPNLGVMERLVIADIPGLIEGASLGRGLGDLFLRHIERTKILVHLVDLSSGGDLWQDYQTVRQELKDYSKELVKKKEIIVLSKADLTDGAAIKAVREVFKKHRKKVLVISARTGEGLAELAKVIMQSNE